MRRLLPALLLTASSLAACGGGTTGTTEATTTTTEPVTTTTAPTTTTTAPPTTTAPTTTTTAAETGTTVSIQISGDEVEGGGRVQVPLGEEVTFLVTSDVAEELHVHGHDLFLDLEPGVESELTFVADIPGIFEVELEGSHRQVASLEVGG